MAVFLKFLHVADEGHDQFTEARIELLEFIHAASVRARDRMLGEVMVRFDKEVAAYERKLAEKKIKPKQFDTGVEFLGYLRGRVDEALWNLLARLHYVESLRVITLSEMKSRISYEIVDF
jgi:hypothetical protein